MRNCTSTLPRVAFEYGQTWCALSTSALAVASSRLGTCTSSSTVEAEPDAARPDAHRGGHLGVRDVGLVGGGDELQGGVEAGGVPAGEQQLRVGELTARPAELLGDLQIEIEHAVVRADVAVAAVAGGVRDGGVEGVHGLTLVRRTSSPPWPRFGRAATG